MAENDIKHNATNREILCIAGYIRRCQKILPSYNPYYNISEIIEYSILCFYSLEILKKEDEKKIKRS